MTPCFIVRGYQRVGGTYFFHLHGGNTEDALCYSEMNVPAYQTARCDDLVGRNRSDLWKKICCIIQIVNHFRTH